MTQEAIALHKKLSDQIRLYDKHYYEESAPLVSDAEYDQIVLMCIDLEKQYPELSKNSPLKKVAGKASAKLGKIKHMVPMLSLANIFSKEEIDDFAERVQKFLKIDYFPQIHAELKIDGLSFSALYKNGKLEYGASRGDGEVGEDITPNLKTLKNFPHSIDIDIESFEVRGEIYMDKEDFLSLNERQKSEGKQVFANPRNAASGSLRHLDSEVTRSRPLKYFIYAIGFSSVKFANTQDELLSKLDKLGFSINPDRALASTKEELEQFYDKYNEARESLPYEIDGIVYKVNDFDLCQRLGAVGRTPRHATAHKFPAYLATTKLLDIKIQVGRTGSLTPVAILDPVNIGGVMVSRASLHNFDEIERKDIRIGDVVSLKRAGDVIPQIDTVIYSARSEGSQKFAIPEECPCCGFKVHKHKDDAVLRCDNSLSCREQVQERMAHFASKPCFNIDGLGKKQMIFLIEHNYIANLVDIFELPDSEKLERLKKEDQWGALSVQNLASSIKAASNVTLDRFIFGLGVRHVGSITSKTLAKLYKDPENFLNSMEKLASGDIDAIATLDNIDGLGSEIITSIKEFFAEALNIDMARRLMQKLTFLEQEAIASSLTDKIIVFTGTMSKGSRNEAKALAEKYGAKVTGSVTSKTDYLVAGEKAGSKLAEAKRLGVKVLSEDEWWELIPALS